ncbi:hypothetical protein [Herminiimonas sp. CN]|uniref:hypothetical protein n=1 Tax=Herminiimonas sp. CN TaxID=1349818 RepID=UPI0012DD74F5|nr:hypothetical protein [Herminiimonas sp. CN]
MATKGLVGAGTMVLIGGAIAYAGYGYGAGTFEHMGSGFVPLVLGVALVVVGLLLGLTAMLAPNDADAGGGAHLHHMGLSGWPDLHGGICIVAGVVAFVVLGEHGGLGVFVDRPIGAWFLGACALLLLVQIGSYARKLVISRAQVQGGGAGVICQN